MPSPQRKLTPTFAQTVVLIQTLSIDQQMDVEAIIQRHLQQGFTYSKDQIYRAIAALTRGLDRPRNKPSARST